MGLLVDIYVRIDDCLMIVMGVSINAGIPKMGDLSGKIIWQILQFDYHNQMGSVQKPCWLMIIVWL